MAFFIPYFLQTEMTRTIKEANAIISDNDSNMLIVITSSYWE